MPARTSRRIVQPRGCFMKTKKKALVAPVLATAVFGLGLGTAFAADPGAGGPDGSTAANEVAQAPPPAPAPPAPPPPGAPAAAPPPAAAPAPAPAAAPAPPSLFPPMGATLSANPNPENFDFGGLIGKVYATGVLSGIGFWQSNPVPGNNDGYADISNGMVFIQNASGPVQFFAQAGIYSIPTLSAPYVRASQLNSLLYGPLPQAFVKFVPNDAFSVQIGRLPTLIGSESTFTFQNVNIERGLLWNQENSVNQGIQANYTVGPWALSLSLNDGFFSGNFDWLTGSATYTINSNNSIIFTAGGNFGSSRLNTFGTPIAQNNSEIYDLIYNGTWGPWTLAPYFQYTYVPDNSALKSAGFTHDASTAGFAVNAAYSFNDNWKLAARGEYVSSSGSLANGAPALLTGGPGANNWSITVTPSYQYKIFFARAEFSYVGLGSTTPGFAFGKSGTDTSQVRVMLETGVLF
jgi:hypothetical protein